MVIQMLTILQWKVSLLSLCCPLIENRLEYKISRKCKQMGEGISWPTWRKEKRNTASLQLGSFEMLWKSTSLQRLLLHPNGSQSLKNDSHSPALSLTKTCKERWNILLESLILSAFRAIANRIKSRRLKNVQAICKLRCRQNKRMISSTMWWFTYPNPNPINISAKGRTSCFLDECLP